MNKPLLSQYVNYRAYLRDWSDWHIKQNESHTWRSLATEIGVDYAAWYKICKETRHLSRKSIPQVMEKMKLNSIEKIEFELLIQIDRAKTEQESTQYQHQLLQVRSEGAMVQIGPENSFFSSWIHPIVFSLLQLNNFQGSQAQCANFLKKLIKFPVSSHQIESSLDLLKYLNKIRCNENNVWSATIQHVSSGIGWNDARIHSYQKECSEMAVRAIETFAKNERDISTYTLQLNRSSLQKVQEAIQQFQAELKKITEESSGEQEIIQLNIQMFPMTQIKMESLK